jgi:predicted MFS family arabinose efflux permease
MLGVYTIVGIEEGRSAPQTMILGAVALSLLAGFLARQATARNPLLRLGVFRSRNVSGANAIQALMVAGMFGMFFMGSLYLQRVLGYDAMQIGLAFLPIAVGIGFLSVDFSARMALRFGARTVLISGLTLVLAGLVLFSRAPADATYLAHVFPVMVLIGIGAGLSFPALMTLAMADATPSDAGLASGLVSTSAQVGGALGLAVLATLASGQTERLHGNGVSMTAALTGGYQLAFGISAGLVAIALALAVVVLRPRTYVERDFAIMRDPRASDVASWEA